MSEIEPQETQQAAPEAQSPAEAPAAAPETPAAEAAPAAAPAEKPKPAGRPDRGPRPPRGDRPERRERPPQERKENGGNRPEGKGERGDRGGRPGDRGERRGPRDAGRGRPPEMQADIDIDRLISDSLYLDNQAHAVVARMRDMDSGTRSQLRRFYSAVRRACRATEADRQHQFVMLRARLAYTIARHQLRSLDSLERLLLQVTRKNDPRGYERFRDLFEAIVAYNE